MIVSRRAERARPPSRNELSATRRDGRQAPSSGQRGPQAGYAVSAAGGRDPDRGFDRDRIVLARRLDQPAPRAASAPAPRRTPRPPGEPIRSTRRQHDRLLAVRHRVVPTEVGPADRVGVLAT